MKHIVVGWLCFGVWARLAAGSVLEDICFHGGDTTMVDATEQAVAPIHISFGVDSPAILHHRQTYMLSVDQEYSEMLIRTRTGLGNVDMQVMSTEGPVECQGSSGEGRQILLLRMTNRVPSVQFMSTGDVNIDVIAILENGQIATGSVASHIHEPSTKGEEIVFSQEAVKETTIRSPMDDSSHSQPESMKARVLSSGYSSLNNQSGLSPVSTPEATAQVPSPAVPTPTSQTFSPTISMKPTSTVAPTYSEICDYGITCQVEVAANVDFAGFLFPCRSLIEFSKIGLVAPDVCEASKAAVQESCRCRQSNVRSASRDKSKRIILLTTPPTPAPTQEVNLAFSNPICGVCHVNGEWPLIISGAEFKCSDLGYYGRMGFFPSDLCPIAQQQAKENCGCSSTKRTSKRIPYNATTKEAASATPYHEPPHEASLSASSSTTRRFAISKATWTVGTVVALMILQ